MKILLDGKNLASQIEKEISDALINHPLSVKPHLGIVQIGNLEESNIYIKHKLNTAKRLGFDASLFKYPEDINQQKLIQNIIDIQKQVDGLIVQLPLPKHLNTQEVLDSILPSKDIDGLNSINTQNLKNFKDCFLPATALGVIILANYYKIDTRNSSVGIVGESQIVGMPVKYALLKNNPNVTSYNKDSDTSNLKIHDILVVATGVKHLIKAKDVKKGASVFDVGIHRDENNKLTGDCDFEAIKDLCYAITPVPGGVGPMTVISLIINLLIAYTQKHTEYKDIFNNILSLAKF